MKLEFKIIIFIIVAFLLYLGNVYLWQSWLWILTPFTIIFSLYGVVKFLNHILKQLK